MTGATGQCKCRPLALSTCLRIFEEFDKNFYNEIKDRTERQLNMDEVSGYARDLRNTHRRAGDE